MVELLIRRAFAKGEPEGHTDCPDPESLASYIDRLTNKREREGLEQHLVQCDHCLEQVFLCSGMKGERPLLENERDPARVLVRFLERTVEVIRGLGEIEVTPSAALLTVRGKKARPPTTAKFSRKFSECTAEIEVERLGKDTAEIRVKVIRNHGRPDNVRISLFRDERELASYVTEADRVLFECVPFGRYRIQLTKDSVSLGDITLTLREA